MNYFIQWLTDYEPIDKEGLMKALKEYHERNLQPIVLEYIEGNNMYFKIFE